MRAGHGENMGRAIDQRGGQWLAAQIANIDPFFRANLNRMQSSAAVRARHARRPKPLRCPCDCQETAEKPFRHGAAANVTGTDEKDAFHKMPPRDPAGTVRYVRTKFR